MATALAAACGTSTGGGGATNVSAAPVTLQFWANSDAALAYAKEYEQRASNVHFENSNVGDYTVIAEKALANVAAGTPPNV